MENVPTFEEILDIELDYAADADDCVYVCPASASLYDSGMYKVMKDSHEVIPYSFPAYVDSDDYDEKRIVDPSEIWDYLQ